MTDRLLLIAVLLLAGAAWGGTQPLAKIAVSEGYRPLGIVFWQMTIGAVALGLICRARGKGLSLHPRDIAFYTFIALIGTILPGFASYSAAVHLPAGVLSILLSTVPMLAFPVALAMRHETFGWRRLAGLTLGFCGISLLVLPDTSLPAGIATAWIFIALLASLCYAVEGNVVAKVGTNGLDPVQVLYGASLVGMAVSLPLAVTAGQFINPLSSWGAPNSAIVASSLMHAGAYTAYVWLVGRAGPVFAVQISYLVTLFGVTWAMLFLGESYSPYFWAALVIMLAGLSLVQPRPKATLVSPHQGGHSEPT